jgi:hypothetical protein
MEIDDIDGFAGGALAATVYALLAAETINNLSAKEPGTGRGWKCTKAVRRRVLDTVVVRHPFTFASIISEKRPDGYFKPLSGQDTCAGHQLWIALMLWRRV